MQNELFKLTPVELIEAKLYTLKRIRKNEHKIIELKKEIKELKHVLTKQGDDIRLINDLLELYRVKALTGADTIQKEE